MIGTLGHWGKKRLCSPERGLYIYISLFVTTLLKNIYIFCGATVSFMLIISSAVSSYVVPSEAPWDGDLFWLLFCIC